MLFSVSGMNRIGKKKLQSIKNLLLKTDFKTSFLMSYF